MAEVFINYRTGDGEQIAELIAERLTSRFGSEHVFKASRSIAPGSAFPEELLNAVRSCEVLLAVIGPDWLQTERLRDPDDWVRTELLEAFAAGKRVIPVLVGRRTDQLHADQLPEELARLALLQSQRIDIHTATIDLDQIGQALTRLIPALKAADWEDNEPTAAPGNPGNTASENSGIVVQGGTIERDLVGFRETYGPAQFGGTQNNFLGEHTKPRLPLRLPQPPDRLYWLDRRFVPPDNFSTAAARLDQSGTVILDGSPGSGRSSAAKMLLLRSSSEASEVHDIGPKDPDEQASFRLDQSAVKPGDRIWVDLSNAAARWEVFQEDLPALHNQVRKCNARLVVIQPHGAKLRFDFTEFRTTIEAPVTLTVFRHLLRAKELLDNEEAVRTLPRALVGHPAMGDIQQFVDYILEIKKRTAGAGGIADWIEAAEERASPNEVHVTEKLEKLQSMRQRALLLSTAMLHGAHADVIDWAATDLLKRLNDDTDTLLQRDPLRGQLEKLGVDSYDMRQVRFTQPGYEFAVRAFFWRHFPELHDTLASWVRTIIGSKSINSDEQQALARAFAEICLEQRYQHFWTDFINDLTADHPSASRIPIASAILRDGLNNQAHGSLFRRQIYAWCTTRDTSPHLVAALVDACLHMARTHPHQAIVRLHHLSRNHPERSDVRETLASVAGTDPWLLSFYLYRLASTGTEAVWATDANLFLDIADASLFTVSRPTSHLLAQQQVVGDLAACWTRAFTQLSPEVWAPTARNWLRGAAEDSIHREALLDVLVDGARRDAKCLTALFGLAYRAKLGDTVADALLHKITLAQGVELS